MTQKSHFNYAFIKGKLRPRYLPFKTFIRFWQYLENRKSGRKSGPNNTKLIFLNNFYFHGISMSHIVFCLYGIFLFYFVLYLYGILLSYTVFCLWHFFVLYLYGILLSYTVFCLYDMFLSYFIQNIYGILVSYKVFCLYGIFVIFCFSFPWHFIVIKFLFL